MNLTQRGYVRLEMACLEGYMDFDKKVKFEYDIIMIILLLCKIGVNL